MDKATLELAKEVVALLGAIIVLITALIGIRNVTKREKPEGTTRPRRRPGVVVSLVVVVFCMIAGAGIALYGGWLPGVAAIVRPQAKPTEEKRTSEDRVAKSPTAPSAPPRLMSRAPVLIEKHQTTIPFHVGLGITHVDGYIYEYKANYGSYTVKSWQGQEVAHCTTDWSSDRSGGMYIFSACDNQTAEVEVSRFQ